MEAIIQNTSEVNPVDLFVRRKITLTTLLYKLMCGAIVTIIALRLNDVLKVGIARLSSELKVKDKIMQSVVDLIVVLVAVVVFSMSVRTYSRI